jgi:hypothetical protein
MKNLFRSALVALLAIALPAAAATVISDNFFYFIATGAVDADTDTFWCTLHTSSMSPAKTWDFRNDLTNEISATGYTAGGHACGVTASVDTTNHRVDINIASHNWTTFTGTARFVCAHKHRGGASSADELMGCFDFGADVTATAGTFTVNAMSPAVRISN